jgi:hypothetical protein
MRTEPRDEAVLERKNIYMMGASNSGLLGFFLSRSWHDKALILACGVPAYFFLHVFVVVCFGVAW